MNPQRLFRFQHERSDKSCIQKHKQRCFLFQIHQMPQRTIILHISLPSASSLCQLSAFHLPPHPWISSWPPAWQFHLQHPSTNIATVPPSSTCLRVSVDPHRHNATLSNLLMLLHQHLRANMESVLLFLGMEPYCCSQIITSSLSHLHCVANQFYPSVVAVTLPITLFLNPGQKLHCPLSWTLSYLYWYVIWNICLSSLHPPQSFSHFIFTNPSNF